MPLIVEIAKRKIARNGDTSPILDIFSTALDKYEISSTGLQSVSGSQKKGAYGILLRLTEGLTGNLHGLNQIILAPIEIPLSAPARELYSLYRNYLNDLKVKMNISTSTTEDELIENKFVLFR